MRKLGARRPFAARCIMGVDNRLAVFSQPDPDNRLCVCGQNKKSATRGLFREKNFFNSTKRFALGITILESIFDFGKREKIKTETVFTISVYFISVRILIPLYDLLRGHLQVCLLHSQHLSLY